MACLPLSSPRHAPHGASRAGAQPFSGIFRPSAEIWISSLHAPFRYPQLLRVGVLALTQSKWPQPSISKWLRECMCTRPPRDCYAGFPTVSRKSRSQSNRCVSNQSATDVGVKARSSLRVDWIRHILNLPLPLMELLLPCRLTRRNGLTFCLLNLVR